ncbi:MAG TPA: POTRA domain-containing protein, partial [Bacteroidota bacterium]|nr:POTRA domain-containing protein [Bacteroidota bacterium]
NDRPVGKDSLSLSLPGFLKKASVNSLPAGFFCLWIAYPELNVAQDTARVVSLTVMSNRSGSAQEIPDNFQTKRNVVYRPAILQEDLKRLIQHYVADGFINARIDSVVIKPSTKNSDVDILVTIEEGMPAVLQSIIFEGLGSLSETELKTRLNLHTGSRFTQRELESYVQRVLAFYEQSGYPFAKIIVNNVSFSESDEAIQTTVVLSVQEGQRVSISELRIEGNRTTKDYVIAREARLGMNEMFDGELPGRIKRRLERLNLFSSVSLPELYLTEDERAGLLVRVTEGNPNSFDGLLGYVPAQRSQESGFFTGLIDVQFRNLLGTGRKLSTRWYRENQFSQEIELRYYEPWIASYPVNSSGEFFQRKQDSTYVRRRYGVNAEFMFSEVLTIGASYGQTNVIPSEGYGKSILAESRQFSIGAYVRYDSRDDPLTPTSGVLYRTEYQLGVKDILSSPTIVTTNRGSTRRITLDLSHYVELVSRQVLSTELHLRDFRTERLEVGDLFRLGGATSVRGYKEGQFLGSTLAWMNMEYRFLVASRSFFYGFADVGYVVVPDNSVSGLLRSELIKGGYGVGMRVDSGLGLIGVNLGFGEGDTFSTAKLHVRLINEF